MLRPVMPHAGHSLPMPLMNVLVLKRTGARMSTMRHLISALRWLLVVFFVLAGTWHFVKPDLYLAIMPSYLPWPAALVAISGVAEILGGLGVALPATRRLAGWGLSALLIAVFPANLNMLMTGAHPPATEFSPLVLWLRLPLQAVLMAWVWLVALRREPHPRG